MKDYTSVRESTLVTSNKTLMCAEEKESPVCDGISGRHNYHVKNLRENSILGGPWKMAFYREKKSMEQHNQRHQVRIWGPSYGNSWLVYRGTCSD